LNTRQIDENQVFNLAATRPDLLTGVNPATGQPTPYGSVGVDINCAVIGYTAQARQPTWLPPSPAPSSRRDRHGVHDQGPADPDSRLRSAGPCWPGGKNAAAR
jgi:hypothetical protein